MESLIIVVSAINLWILGIFIHIYNTIISFFIKKNAQLSKKHIVLAFRIYERFLTIWHQKEKNHIKLLRKKLTPDQYPSEL